MMVMRQVRCRRCRKKFQLSVPEKMSRIGVEVLSVCAVCRAAEEVSRDA